MRVSADPPVADRAARATIAVASGKGGVGKSTISLNIALALAERGAATGILDADLYGPDIPLMVNLKQTRRLERWTLYRAGGDFSLEPVERFGIKIMSVGLLLAEEQAFSWPPEVLESALRQLVGDVRWEDSSSSSSTSRPGPPRSSNTCSGSWPGRGRSSW